VTERRAWGKKQKAKELTEASAIPFGEAMAKGLKG